MMQHLYFKEFIALQRGFDLPKKEMCDGPYPVVGSTSIIGFHNEYKIEPPGAVTGRSGSLGFVQYIRERYWPHNTSLWVKDFKGNLPQYVFYFLKTLNLQRFNSGVGVPTLNRNDLDTFEVSIHPINTQRKIAAILSAYDDLIENNLRRIKILEEMAQNLYTEWFVKFRFPGHEKVNMVDSPLGRIPEGWEITKLFDAAEVTYGFPFNSRLFTQEPIGKPVIRIRDILNGTSKTYTSENTKDKYIVSNGDILIGMDGKFHMCKWANGEAMLNQRVVRLRPKIELSTYYLFLSMKEPIEYFENTIVGTTVAHLSDEDLRSIEILIPNEMVSKSANDLLNDIFNEEIKLKQVNLNLHSTRDLLLPRLISGEIDVSDLDIKTGDNE